MWISSFHHLLIIVFCFVCAAVAEGRTIAEAPKVAALYVFGDSLVENGNNNHLLTVAKGDYYPYGVDFPNGHTGRFSNGKTIADIVSDYLHLPFSPPYMESSRTSKWLTGYNYASSACGILPESGSLLGHCLNMDTQIRYFQDTIDLRLKKHYTNRTDLSQHLSNSVALFVIGSNDYLNNYSNRLYRNDYKNMTPEEFSNVLAERLSQQLQKLYNLGIRKMIFSEVPPVGCMPFTSNSTFHRQKVCDETKNKVVSVFNERLEELFSTLRSTLTDSKLAVVKIYKIVQDILHNPTKFGFEDSRDTCCKATNFKLKCLPGLRPCKNRNKYCFWDGFHPTEAMCSYVIAQSLIDNPIDFVLE